MSAAKPPMWQRLSVGGTFAAVGGFIMLVGAGVVPVDPESVHAPMWLIATAGLVFVLTGVMMLAGWLEKEGATPIGTKASPNPMLYACISAMLVCFAVLGRVMFGVGALLCWAVLAAAAFHAWRRRFGKPK